MAGLLLEINLKQFRKKFNLQEEGTEEQSPRLDSLDFWSNLITLVASVLEEDKDVYAHVLNQYVQLYLLS